MVAALEKLGIINPKAVYRNLSPARLVEQACAAAKAAFPPRGAGGHHR